MSRTYLEIAISSTGHQRDVLIATMVELGCSGFQESDSHLLCYIEKTDWSDEKTRSLTQALRTILHTVSSNAAIGFRDVEEKNWNEEWERTVKPVEVGRHIVIKPSWCEYANSENRSVIRIDPKMSFGTGHHESTRLTLLLLEKHILPRGSMLDVGTGTGVLAIAGIKLGASSCVALDNDEWAIANARENVLANGLETSVEVLDIPLQSLEPAFSIICANLALDTILLMMDHFVRLLLKDGVLLLSGLLTEDEARIKDEVARRGLVVADRLAENEWTALAVRRTPRE